MRIIKALFETVRPNWSMEQWKELGFGCLVAWGIISFIVTIAIGAPHFFFPKEPTGIPENIETMLLIICSPMVIVVIAVTLYLFAKDFWTEFKHHYELTERKDK
jgi:hypothetical protein